MSNQSAMSDTTENELILTLPYRTFDTTVQVLFSKTPDSMSDCQKKTYEGFIAKQDLLTTDILNAIFEHYKASYTDYKVGWTMVGELSKKGIGRKSTHSYNS